MRRTLLFAAGVISLTLAAPVFATPVRAVSASAGHYFVEFRARDGISGHTYVVYGRTDGRGRTVTARAAGFYPDGAFSESALTVLLPFPGQIGLQPADRRDPPTAIYRIYLDAGRYARLAATVEGFRKSRSTWHLVFFNCNAFAARIARSVGLRAPSTLQIPNSFIRDLYFLNRPRHAGLARAGHGAKRP